MNRRAPWLSLFGAYYPLDEALACKPFVVDLYTPEDFWTVLGGKLAVSALVHAEGLAADVSATARLSLRRPEVECRIAFLSDAGTMHEAIVAARLGRRIFRALTELSGEIRAPGGVAFGVRLRLNWRALPPWGS